MADPVKAPAFPEEWRMTESEIRAFDFSVQLGRQSRLRAKAEAAAIGRRQKRIEAEQLRALLCARKRRG